MPSEVILLAYTEYYFLFHNIHINQVIQKIQKPSNSKNMITDIDTIAPLFAPLDTELFIVEDVNVQSLNNTITKKFTSKASDNAKIFKWDFGDGTPILETNDRVVLHTYASLGVYLVKHQACAYSWCCSKWCHRCIKICKPPGTGSPGYWKNHPDAWPVNIISIGNINYSKEVAIQIMQTPEKGDKTYTMFNALISAKLNVIIGNDDSCVANTISMADTWMATYGPVGRNVTGNSHAWKIGEPLYNILDTYNNGLLCAPYRGEDKEEECEAEEMIREEEECETEKERIERESLNMPYSPLQIEVEKEEIAKSEFPVLLGLGILFGFLFIIDKKHKLS